MLMKINNGKDFKKPDPVGAAGALAKIFSFFVPKQGPIISKLSKLRAAVNSNFFEPP